MKKVFLAIGNQEAENYLRQSLDKEFIFIGHSGYREGVLLNTEKQIPEILILGESLDGNIDILELVTKIREKYNRTRIIFVAYQRNEGDPVLAELVNRGVYDIIAESNVTVKHIVALMRKPNEYKDVSKYQMKVKVDESKHENKQRPQQKEVIEIERIIEKEVPVEVIKVVEKEIIKDVIREIPIVQELPAHLQPNFDNNKQKKFLEKIFSKKKIKPNNSFANKVVVFTGGKGGVGTTTLALNTALRIAEMNRKVLYIELNPTTPTASFWFDIELKYGKGIDQLLKDIVQQNMTIASQSLTRARIKGKEIEVAPSLNEPGFETGNIIDFMFFSAEAMEKKLSLNDMEISNFKEIFLTLFYQENYNFVIIDIPFQYNNLKGVIDAFIYSHKIFTVISQDVASVGYTVKDIETLEKRDIRYKQKNTFIMNRAEPSKKLNMKELLQWLETDSLISIPNYTDFADIIVQGKPILTNAKDPSFRKHIDDIVSEL